METIFRNGHESKMTNCEVCNTHVEADEAEGNHEDGWTCYECLENIKRGD